MKIKLVCVGKTTSSYLKEGESEYIKRLGHYCAFEMIEIPELKNVRKLSKDQIKVEEGKLILAKMGIGESLILLDENGKNYASEKFAQFLQKQMNQGGKGIVFVVGGAYGFSDEVYQRSQHKISLSLMTFSHQMVRLFFLEQLYRAHTILNGEPYHHN